MQVGEQVEVLGDAQVLVEAEALRHVADRRMRQRRIGCHVMAEYSDVPTRGAQEAGDQAQQRGLAGGIRPDQAGDDPRLDGGGHTIQRDMRRSTVRAGESVTQRVDDDDRLGHRAAGNPDGYRHALADAVVGVLDPDAQPIDELRAQFGGLHRLGRELRGGRDIADAAAIGPVRRRRR